MSVSRWQEVKALFDAASKRAPSERVRFLDEACPNEEIRREVESLLRVEIESFLEDSPAASSPVERYNLIGRQLSHYKVLSEVSRGGMGIVYRALDVKLNREVAIKVLSPELTDNAERKRRFVQEAQATAALEHPHIAVIYEIDDADADADAEAEAEGVTFIAMELIRGDKLSDLLAKEKLTVARALEIAIEISEGLSRAHERGIVHRDLKPANIMITYDGHVKFIDFGLAKLMERAMPEVSRSIIEATFSASESFLRDTDRFDPLQKGERVETLNAIINTRAPPLEDSVDAALTPPLQRVLDGSLAKDATDRYPEMKALLSDLRLAKRDSDSRGSGAKPWRGPRQARALLTPRRSWALPLAIGAAAATIGIYVYSVREPPPPRLSAQFK